MSDRTTARSTERFLGALGAGASSENWMAGGSFRDVLMELHKEGHISDVQYVTACRLVQDMQRAHGSSAGIVSQPQERVQTSLRSRTAPPAAAIRTPLRAWTACCRSSEATSATSWRS